MRKTKENILIASSILAKEFIEAGSELICWTVLFMAAKIRTYMTDETFTSINCKL